MLAAFLLHEVEAPLGKRLEAGSSAGEIDWFTYALHRWTLTADNHLGDLVGARTAAVQLDVLTPALAQRWEHASLLMQGLIAQAFHRTDCFAYDDVAARMKAVTGYFSELSSLFSAAMPDVFPDQIRSKARAGQGRRSRHAHRELFEQVDAFVLDHAITAQPRPHSPNRSPIRVVPPIVTSSFPSRRRSSRAKPDTPRRGVAWQRCASSND